MIAYTTTDLDNEAIGDAASQAFRHEYINGDTYQKILTAHHSQLYTPQFFIRIGLMILTLLIIAFSAGLLALIFDAFSSFTVFFIFMTVLCYVSLELMVKKKKYYNAGIDNLLQWGTFLFLAFAISFNYSHQVIVMTFLLFLASAWMAWRFVDASMSIAAYFSLLAFIFFVYTKFGEVAKVTAPFVLMLVSALIFFVVKKVRHIHLLKYHGFCLDAVKVCCLLSFYACGNYFVVKEVSNEMFDLRLKLTDTIPFGWLFWMLTITISIAYIIYGLLKKDRIFIRTGLFLLAMTVATVVYYSASLTIEKVFLAAGVILTALSYAGIKYLDTPKMGFTFEEDMSANKDLLQLEALILAQTFGKKAQSQPQIDFNGGSGGGGGGGGNY